METTAVVVARGGSVRLPRKNLLEIGGETLVGRKIKQLKDCLKIDRVVVGSDDSEILEVADKYGVEAVVRPEPYCDEAVTPANGMISNMMDLITTDV